MLHGISEEDNTLRRAARVVVVVVSHRSLSAEGRSCPATTGRKMVNQTASANLFCRLRLTGQVTSGWTMKRASCKGSGRKTTTSSSRIELKFDAEKHREYVTGFHKRKVERRRLAEEELKRKERAHRKQTKKEVMQSVHQRYQEVATLRQALDLKLNKINGPSDDVATLEHTLKEAFTTQLRHQQEPTVRSLCSEFYSVPGVVTVSTQPLDFSDLFLGKEDTTEPPKATEHPRVDPSTTKTSREHRSGRDARKR